MSYCSSLQLWTPRETSHAVCGPAGSWEQDCDIQRACAAGMSGETSVCEQGDYRMEYSRAGGLATSSGLKQKAS